MMEVLQSPEVRREPGDGQRCESQLNVGSAARRGCPAIEGVVSAASPPYDSGGSCRSAESGTANCGRSGGPIDLRLSDGRNHRTRPR